MPTELYKKYYKSFYPPATQKIISLLKDNINTCQSVLEVGFGSGHLMFLLTEEGYKPEGIEIRDEAYKKTSDIFNDAGLSNKLINGDFLKYNREYDIIYSTGLIQCLNGTLRDEFIKHISALCKKAIIVVPEILCSRNIGSDCKVAVSGCEEYSTCEMLTELYKHFNYVREGRWDKTELELDDSFLYYICLNI